jgi:hypothetical protein
VTKGSSGPLPQAEGRVKHFSDELWTDFVRNLAPASTAQAMQKHIEDGCGKCEAVLKGWQSVFQIAKEESNFSPPQDTVRIVKSQFAAVAGVQQERRVRLVFDTNLQPITAGVRGSISARQLLYETDELYIDLRLEPHREANRDRVCLVGQILDRTSETRAVRGLKVQLLQGQQAVSDTATNQHGEFQLEFDAGKDMCLWIGHQKDQMVVLPIYGVHGSSWDLNNPGSKA